MFDLDKVALREVEQTLSLALSRGEGTEQQAPTTYYIHSNFRNIKSELEKINIKVVDKIFADLGLSSQELDISGRGFTFQKDEPLHMTLNSEINENTLTAKDLLNTLNIQQLTDIFRNYGDDKNSYKIAKYIVEQRENEK
jgi:16S rRNA (cytosine1402-N4)-methyltransferase